MYLNVDLGEEIIPNLEIEKAIMPYIDACNIACGGHAGDEHTMKKSILLAQKYKVKIGAHPSYPDRSNFGRLSMKIDDEKLRTSILQQLYILHGICEKENVKIHHIKLHGALYNDTARDTKLATLVVKAIQTYNPNCILLIPPKSIISDIARLHNLRTHYEVFGDRNYNDDLSLMSRSHKNALITNQVDLYTHVKSIIFDQKIISIHGKSTLVKMDTICMHSDHDKAVDNIIFLAKWIKNNQT